MAIDLKKVEQQAPELLKKAEITKLSLEKAKLSDHVARVVLVLDISGSMEPLYRAGKVQELVCRALPLGLGFDDDGEIDVFAFGSNAKEIGGYGLHNYKNCVRDILSKTSWSGTRYHTAIELIEQKYADSKDPVYVMFVTDGDTEDKQRAADAIRRISSKPIFFQFIAIGQQPPKSTGFMSRLLGSISGSSKFEFLEEMDNMIGRAVDNANFFAVAEPASTPDNEFYDLMMGEYPQWLKAARKKGITR